MTATYRVARTEELLSFSNEALDRNLNRALSEKDSENIDPQGLHVLSNVYLLDDLTLMRTEWLVKFKDKDEPVLVHIDILSNSKLRKMFDDLPRVESV